MTYKIVADSSCDLTPELKQELKIKLVPLKLQVKDHVYVDDESLDIKAYIQAMNEAHEAPKSACPSPQDFIDAYRGEDAIFGITLSKELSGTYQSAILARNLYLEEEKDKFIHIFNSTSASAGETLIALKIQELAELGKTKEVIVEEVESFIAGMKTFFLLESLEHLAKNGRLNPIIAKVASFLSIKVIAGASDEGTIQLEEKIRGYKKAFKRFVDTIGKYGNDFSQRTLVIAHCNCVDRAHEFKSEVEQQYNFKQIVVVPMAGLSSTYADDGGLVIAF
jgi:DegV family protein with EDD domain